MSLQFILFTLISSFLTFFLNLFFTPFIIWWSHKHQWFDDETDERKIHAGRISRLGGLGIVASLLLGAVLSFFISSFWDRESFISLHKLLNRHFYIMAGGLVIFIVGLLDDFTALKARYKLIGQVAAASLAMAGGVIFREQSVPFTNQVLSLGWFGPVLTLLWIVGVTNAINLIDGMDGLSSGIAATVSFTYGLVFLSRGCPGLAIAAFLLLGSLLGYMFYNFPPAQIFMGDSGSQTLGFLLAVLPLLPSGEAGDNLVMPAVALLIPIADVISAILRRWSKGQHFFIPDREHMHHKLLDMNLKTRYVLAIVISLQLLSGLALLFFNIMGGRLRYLPVGLYTLIILIFFLFLHWNKQPQE